MAMRALFRADASAMLGGGHVMRCLTLARVMAVQGWHCRFAGRQETLATVPALAASGFDFVPLDGPPELEPERMAAASGDGCDLLVVDDYRWQAGQEQACRHFARRILVIDDLADRPHDADILLDQTHGRKAADYAGLLPAAAEVRLGAGYALLRPDFYQRRGASLARRQSGGLQRILVTMGLTDAPNATGLAIAGIVQACRQLGRRIAVDIVLGESAPYRREIAAQAQAAGMQLHVGPTDMAGLMVTADLAIGAAGSTAWERCCLGLPSLMLITADNQRQVAAGLEATGAALVLGTWPGVTAGALADAVCHLAEPQRLLAMGLAGAQLCDGRGALRMLLVIDPLRADDAGAVELRPARAEDVTITYAWQTAAGVRSHFRNPHPPDAKEHAAWFSRSLADPGRLLHIILHAGRPAGVLRLDQVAGGYEVSILVAPDCQRLGIGAAALKLARRLLPEQPLLAEVLPGNLASARLFPAAGYVETAPGHYRAAPLLPAAGEAAA